MPSHIKNNFLSPLEYRFLIHRLPYTEFFTQSVAVPGISSTPAEMSTPFKKVYFSPDKMSYEDLTISVRVDENMNNYQEIHNWIVGLTFPERFDQFANLKAGDGLYSDATLMILTNGKNPNINIVYKDVFPISLSAIQMNTKQTDVDYVTCDITFKISGYEIRTE